MGYVYISLTILLTVYGQLVLKWQVLAAGVVAPDAVEKLLFVLRMLWNPWILSGFAAAFLASMAWMAAMTKFELSYAYPFMSLSFVLVTVFSVAVFGESLTLAKAVGLGMIVAGIAIGSQG